MSVEPVVIVEYDDDWPSAFEAVAAELAESIGEWLVATEHIGSTAVAGLAAKPIIDVMAGIVSLDATPQIVAALEQRGWQYVPEYERQLPNRRYFRRVSASGPSTHHLHVVERSDHGWWDRHVGFRDWLRSHPDDRDRYAALKRSLASRHRDDRAAYTDAKSDFIDAIVGRAALSG